MSRETEIGSGGRAFPETRWTLIRSSRSSEEARRVALGELLGAYWRPLYFFARRKGLAVEPAKDAVQDFAAHLLARDALGRLDPDKGRFRSYLRAAFANHMANLRDRESAQRRGGGRAPLSLDVEAAEAELERAPHARDEAGDCFDREWAVGVMERALRALEEELADGRGGAARPELLRRFFGLGDPPPTYAAAAAGTGTTEAAVKAQVFRARARFRELVRREVAQTVGGEGELEAELEELLRLVGREP